MSCEFKTLAELFQDPARHTKESFARTSRAVPVDALDPCATCWCLLGGFEKVYRDADRSIQETAWRRLKAALRKRTPTQPIVTYNDDPKTTPQDIYQLCLEAEI